MVGQLHYFPTPMANTMDTQTFKPEPSEGVETLANEEVRRLMQIIQSLRHLGIEAQDLPFPKLCVTGDQSTGKSSLIEGISEIKVPRGSGTCTRCPVEINLSDDPSLDAEWRCEVSLSQKYSFAPNVQNRATRNKPLGPWIEKDLETFPFATLRTKDMVGPALEWAQLATLNPSSDYKVYKPGSNHGTAHTLQVPFSPNVVRLDICGPGLPNLSFYDLPGIVSRDQHNYVPLLVENLVKEYIRAENCIVLHTLTMNHDAANSIAARIISESKADDRTIGVLTKPDLFGSESIQQWRDILDGSMFPRKLGYYVVKNNAKITVEHATARSEEKTFFETMPPFSTELKAHSQRFGTGRLQRALSMMLATQIKASLPKLITEIGSKLEDKKARIGQMPKPPGGNVAGTVEAKIFEFFQKIAKEISGGDFECETKFFTEWLGEAKRFGELLICSRPLILRPHELTPPPPREPPEATTPSRSGGPIDAMIISDDEEEPIAKRQKVTSTPQSGQKRQNRGEFGPALPQRESLNVRIRRKDAYSEAQKYNKRFTTEEVDDKFKKLDTGAGSAGHPKMTENMFQESITHWPGLTEDFLDTTEKICRANLSNLTRIAFGCWSETALYRKIIEAVENFLVHAFANQRKSLNAICAMEKRKLLVLETEEDTYNQNEIFSELQASSRAWRVEYQLSRLARNGKPLKEFEKENIAETVRSQQDPYSDILRELAKVRAHYHSSAIQFGRYSALSVCTSLFESIRDTLPNEIRHAIGLDLENANDICKQLLAVRPDIEQERQRLLRDAHALQGGLDQLSALLQPSSMEDTSSFAAVNHRDDYPMHDLGERSSAQNVHGPRSSLSYRNSTQSGGNSFYSTQSDMFAGPSQYNGNGFHD